MFYSILEATEDHPSSTDSRTPSDNASTHPQLDNLPTQQWNGLSVSTENPDQLSDPFSNKGESDSLAGGDASERSSLLSGVESDRMKDLDDMDSPRPDGDGDNDTPRTMDADLDSDLEAAENDSPRSTNSAPGERKNEGALRTIDIDMRSVSQINTEHEENQSAIESQISDKESVKSFNDQYINTKDQYINNDQYIEAKDQFINTKDHDKDTKDHDIDNENNYTNTKEHTTDQTENVNVGTTEKTNNEQETKTEVAESSDNDEQTNSQELKSSDGGNMSMKPKEILLEKDDSNSTEIPSEKDILTGAEKGS